MKYKIPLFASLLLAFGIGLFFGVKYHIFILNKLSKNIYFCPSAKVALRNFYKVGDWSDQHLLWSIENHSWKPGQKIYFSQALINKSGDLFCYYDWPALKQPNTRFWFTLKLKPTINMSIKTAGLNWSSAENNTLKLCEASLKGCGVRINRVAEIKVGS